jgi:hypothetical protein
MQRSATLEVRKNALADSRLAEQDLPPLGDGEVLARVDRFALTANNITYGVVGEKIGYWRFFPAAEGWGVIPVWGFADVVESRHPGVVAGERLYGYFPMGTHLVLRPSGVKPERLLDGALHRAALPPVYNSYTRVRSEPQYDPALDDERMLLFPLYATSFCLYDFLSDNQWFGAQQIVIVSASSKTALGLALALADDETSPPAVALTSRQNLAWVSGLGLYSGAYDYAGLDAVDAAIPTVIVDMSGNGTVLSALHERLGGSMRHCANVGITHYDETAMGPGFIAERSAMFFAPAHIQKRTEEWGPGVFQKQAFDFWRRAAVRSRAWLRLERFAGLAGLQTAYRRVLAGEINPDRGVIVDLPGSG